ncbi:hypothetical protein [Streptomyces sp. Y1]|uniref:Sensor histidine kinase n=1 Tax=Streptomyces sp. Y1 TaxID=3238634 RepID=A0AB39TWN3_9ACTN
MTRRAWTYFRAGRRARLVATLAGASWLPFAAAALPAATSGFWHGVGLFALVIALTLLPLIAPSRALFRRWCLIIGWVLLVLQAALSFPFAFIPLPLVVLYLPAGVLLLLAARRTAGVAVTVVASVLTGVPYLVDLAWAMDWPTNLWA